MTTQSSRPADEALGEIESPTISIRYSPEEDRLRVQVLDPLTRTLLFDLTRRLAGPLIKGLADLLETSNTTLSRTPADYQQDAMEMTHQANVSTAVAKEEAPVVALEDLLPSNAVEPKEDTKIEDKPLKPHKTRLAPPLVQKVHFSERPDGKGHFLVFEDIDGEQTALRTDTAILHGILEILIKKCRDAGWGIETPKKWAGPRSEQAKSAEKRLS